MAHAGFVLLLMAGFAIGCSADEALDTDMTAEQATEEMREPGDSAPARPFVPGDAPGTAANYDALVSELTELVPQELQNQVPWPRLRDVDPTVAQRDIFALWTWMAEHLPEPAFVDLLAHPDGPGRAEVATLFGRLNQQRFRHVRQAPGYQVTDQRSVEFGTADLPIWFTRDVPEGAVLIWYTDQSTAMTVIDEDDNIVSEAGAVPPRDWVAILVPSDIGWLIWRDELIEPGESDFTYPAVELPPQTRTDV